jgi:tetratricopeptide (TPR) repeat protein
LAKQVQEEQNINLTALLERAGFEKTTRPGWVTWIFSAPEINRSENSGKKPSQKKTMADNPLWTPQGVEISERKGQFHLTGVRLSLDTNRLRDNLAKAIRKFFGARTTPTIVDCGRGTYWILLEFVKSGAKKKQVRQNAADYLPYGVAGYKVGFGSSGGNIEVYFSDFFGVGFVPQAFMAAHGRILLEALGLRKIADKYPVLVDQRSLFETSISAKLALVLAAGDAADESLEAFLPAKERPSGLNLSVGKGLLQFELGGEEAGFDLRHTSPVPVVVLEARERTDALGEIDRFFIDGKISRGSRAIVEATRGGMVASYLLQRLSLLSVCGHDIPDDVVTANESVNPAERKLLLSHKVRHAALNGKMNDVLEHLSGLGRLLAADVPDMESVKSFDLVIPELLGDAWSPVNVRKAEACYERILQRCGDLPRILRKIITLTKAEADNTREFRLLDRLSVVERRKNELARIFYRMAELARDHGEFHKDPAQLAFRALQSDRNHYQSALLAAELLNRSGKPNEAIALLDQMLGDGSVNIPQKARARLEHAIGVTWMSSLDRQDLAERRFERAIALDETQIDSLALLEQIYRESGQTHKIGALLEKQFDAYERSGDLENLKRVFEELVELFRGPMGQPKKAYELYQRMLALAIVEPEEIDKLMAWRDIEIDWQAIYDKLVDNLRHLPGGALSARYHMRLAEICRDKINNQDGTLSHYLSALDHGGIDSNGFRFVVEKLTLSHDLDRLAEVFEVRLKQVDTAERSELIGEILSFPGVLSDPRRDQLAVEAYAADDAKSSLLFQRLKYYQSMDDVEGLERFGEVIVDIVKSPTKSAQWLRNVIEALQECVDPAKFRAIDKHFRKIYETDPDPVSVLADAVRLFKDTMDSGRCSFYLRELLKHDEIPDLSAKLVARYLVGFDADLARFHYLRAAAAKKKEDICSDARVACTIYKRLPGHHKMQEKSLHLIGMNEVLTDVDLKDVVSLAGITENWTDAARVFQKQADFTPDQEKKGKLLIEQGRMLWKEGRDPGRARLAYVMALNYVKHKAPVKMILAQLAEESGQQEQEARALVDFVLDDESSGEEASYLRAISRMITLGKEPYSVYKLIRPRLAAAAADDNNSFVLKTAETLISAGLMNQELFVFSFRAAVDDRIADEAVDYWWRGLKSVQNKTGIRSYIAETQAVLKSADREDLLLKCYRAAIQSGITNEVPEVVKQEVLVQYGLLMFDSDVRRNKALPVFKEAYKSDPADNRTWLPVYFILEEQGDQHQQYLFLKEMLVRLREDTRPLRQYPVTIESLEKQLRELAAQFGDRHGTKQQFIDQSESIQLNVEGTGVSRIVSINETSSRLMPVAASQEEASQPIPLEEIASIMVSGDSVSAPAEPARGRDLHLSLVVSPAAGGDPEPAPVAGDPDPVVQLAEADAFIPAIQGSDEGAVDGIPDFNIEVPLEIDVVAAPPAEEEYEYSHVPDPAMFGGEPPAAAGNPFDSPDVSLVIDLGAVGSESPELPVMESDSAGPDLSMDLSGVDGLDFGGLSEGSQFDPPPPPPLAAGGDGMSGPSFSLDMADPVQLEIPEPPVAAASPESIDFQLDIAASPEGSMVPPPPPPPGGMTSPDEDSGVLLLNPDVPGIHINDELSSVELAAALDIKEVLPVEEYTSSDASLQAEVSSLSNPSREVTLTPPPGMLEPSQGSIHVVNSGLDDGHPGSHDTADWRALILSGGVQADLTERLMRQAFANEVEKHVALQCIALIAGNCHLLETWHWRVWRNSREYGYPLSGRDRFNSEYTSPALQSTLHQFVIACNPLMAKVFRERFTLDHVAKGLGVSLQTIEKAKRQVSWKQGVLADVGFHLYTERIEKRGYQAFNLPGLGPMVFFEGAKKGIYFDEAWFSKQPPAVLFHRILSLLWSIRLQYFIPLALDPKKQVFPFLVEVHQKLDMQGISKIAEKLKSKSPLAKYLATVDVRTLQSLKTKTGTPTEAQVAGLWFAMQEHVYKLILSETLDLIGLFEAILKRDLTKSNTLKLNEIFGLTPYAKSLLGFSTKLVL